jgi:hypothetical protein
MAPKITQAAARAAAKAKAAAKAAAKAKAKAQAQPQPTLRVVEGPWANRDEWFYMVAWGAMELRTYGHVQTLVLSAGPDTFHAKLERNGDMCVRHQAGIACAPMMVKAYVAFGDMTELSGTPRNQHEVMLIGPSDLQKDRIVNAPDTRALVDEVVVASLEGGPTATWVRLELITIPLPFLVALQTYGCPET